MIPEDQSAVVRFLDTSATHAGMAVERIETHASIVFLAGTRALKLKRAVRYDYLDFSSAERRKAMCEAEVRVNRRTAPSLYRGVVPVVRISNGSLALGGPGTPIDWVVDMNRFDQEYLFDRMAARGVLDLALMGPLASGVARFHLAANRRSDHGSKAGMGWVIEGNAEGFAEQGKGILDHAVATRLTADSRVVLERHAMLLDRRRPRRHRGSKRRGAETTERCRSADAARRSRVLGGYDSAGLRRDHRLRTAHPPDRSVRHRGRRVRPSPRS